MSLLGLARPVKRTDFSKIPCVQEAGEGLSWLIRLDSRRWTQLLTQTTKKHKTFTAVIHKGR